MATLGLKPQGKGTCPDGDKGPLGWWEQEYHADGECCNGIVYKVYRKCRNEGRVLVGFQERQPSDL